MMNCTEIRRAWSGVDHLSGGSNSAVRIALHAGFSVLRVRRSVKHARALPVQLGRAAAENLQKQGVLRAEVVVDAGEVNARLRGDVPHGDVLKAVQGEQALGRAEDGGLGGGFGFGVVDRVVRRRRRISHRAFQTLV